MLQVRVSGQPLEPVPGIPSPISAQRASHAPGCHPTGDRDSGPPGSWAGSPRGASVIPAGGADRPLWPRRAAL